MPNGKKKKGHKMATHKRKKRLRKNRLQSKYGFKVYSLVGRVNVSVKDFLTRLYL